MSGGLRILVTGSREWIDRKAIAAALDDVIAEFLPADGCWPDSDITLVHGAARGADTIADHIARERGWTREPWPVLPVDWDRYGRSAGHRRNAVMVEAGADVCVAFPLGASRGTRGCMALAEKAGMQVINYGEEIAA